MIKTLFLSFLLLLPSCTAFSESQRITLERSLQAEATKASDQLASGEITQQEFTSRMEDIARARDVITSDRSLEESGVGLLGLLGITSAQAAALLALIRAWRGPASSRLAKQKMEAG